MTKTGIRLSAVAALTLVVPLLATSAGAAPVAVPQLSVQPPQRLAPPEPAQPWWAVGVNASGSQDEGGYDLYGLEQAEVDVLTRTSAPIVGSTLGQLQPSFSPDGSQVILSAQQDDGPQASWVLKSGNVAPAGTGPGVSNLRELDYPTVPGAADYQPAWSPDGERIAFVREFSDSGARADDGPQVQVLDLSSGTLTEITLPMDTRGVGGDSRWTMSPTWAPDGSGLLVTGSTGESTADGADVGTGGPLDPAAAGAGSLWYYDLGSGVHQILVSAPGCGGGPSPCGAPIEADTVAWSPTDAATAAYTAPDDEAVYLLTLPAALPTGGDADVVLTEAPVPLLDGASSSLYQDLAWDPEGSAVYAIEAGAPEMLRIDPSAGSTVVYDGADGSLRGLAYQPFSDLGITLDVPQSAPTGTGISVTAEVTNAGPSPSRPGQVQIELDYSSIPSPGPADCERTEAAMLCTFDVDGLSVGESTQVAVTVPVDATEPAPAITGIVTADSPEKPSTTANNHAVGTIAVSIIQQPEDVTVDEGGDASFTAAAWGSPVPTVQWQVLPVGETTWQDLAGETEPQLTLDHATEPDSGAQYRAVFTQGESVLTSDPALLTVTEPALDAPGLVSDLTARAFGPDAVTVSWSAPENDGGSAVTGYHVQMFFDEGTPVTDATTTLEGTAATVSGLAPGTSYTIVVTASNAVGTGEPATTTVTTPRGPAASGPPTWTPDLPGDDELITDTRGPVVVTPGTVAPGGTVAVSGLGEGWFHFWIASDPVALGWSEASDGAVRLTVPASTDPGAHLVIVHDPDGLVGWASLTVTPPAVSGPGDQVGDASGAGAGPQDGGTTTIAVDGDTATVTGGGLPHTGTDLPAQLAVVAALLMAGAVLVARGHRLQPRGRR